MSPLLRAWRGNHLKWPKLRDQAKHEGHEGPVLFWLLIIVLLQYCFSSLDGYEMVWTRFHTEFMMMRSGCIALSFMFSRNLPKFQSKELGQPRNCHLSCQQKNRPRVSLTPSGYLGILAFVKFLPVLSSVISCKWWILHLPGDHLNRLPSQVYTQKNLQHLLWLPNNRYLCPLERRNYGGSLQPTWNPQKKT